MAKIVVGMQPQQTIFTVEIILLELYKLQLLAVHVVEESLNQSTQVSKDISCQRFISIVTLDTFKDTVDVGIA
jgi:hypothetical protein